MHLSLDCAFKGVTLKRLLTKHADQTLGLVVAVLPTDIERPTQALVNCTLDDLHPRTCPTATMLSRQALLRSARAAPPSRAFASQIRTYAAATESVKPPVALFGLDGTYATALVRHRAESAPKTSWTLDL